MSTFGKTQEDPLKEISASARSGARELHNISKNSNSSIINRALLLGLSLLVADALIVSDFQPQVALGILRESSWMTVLVGTLLNVLPIVVPVLGTALLVISAMKFCSAEFSDGMTKLVQSFCVFSASWLVLDRDLVWSPEVMIWVFASVLIFGLIIGSLWGWKESVERFAGAIMLMTILGSIVLALTNSAVSGALARPYMPAEMITIDSGDKGRESLVGYVLSVDPSGQWTTILEEEERQIRIVSSGSLSNREVCEPGDEPQYTPGWPLFVSGGSDESVAESFMNLMREQRTMSSVGSCREGG